MSRIHKAGKLRGDKAQYKDGIGCTVWYPWNDTECQEDEESGICFDFSFSDIDDFIALLQMLKTEPAEKMEERDDTI